MLFNRPAPPLTKITAPTAAEVCAKSNPSPEGKALLQPNMSPGQYQSSLEKNKRSVDSVNFLAHGMQPTDSICWACQASRMVSGKLSGPELNALTSTECWLKNPLVGMRGSMAAALGQVDFKGPGSWAAQAGMWAPIPGAPAIPGAAGLTAAAVIGAIMLAAGLKIGPAMPPIPSPKLALPLAPPTPAMLLALARPPIPVPPPIPVVDQPALMKMLFPFIDLGKAVANGSVTCC